MENEICDSSLTQLIEKQQIHIQEFARLNQQLENTKDELNRTTKEIADRYAKIQKNTKHQNEQPLEFQINENMPLTVEKKLETDSSQSLSTESFGANETLSRSSSSSNAPKPLPRRPIRNKPNKTELLIKMRTRRHTDFSSISPIKPVLDRNNEDKKKPPKILPKTPALQRRSMPVILLSDITAEAGKVNLNKHISCENITQYNIKESPNANIQNDHKENINLKSKEIFVETPTKNGSPFRVRRTKSSNSSKSLKKLRGKVTFEKETKSDESNSEFKDSKSSKRKSLKRTMRDKIKSMGKYDGLTLDPSNNEVVVYVDPKKVTYISVPFTDSDQALKVRENLCESESISFDNEILSVWLPRKGEIIASNYGKINEEEEEKKNVDSIYEISEETSITPNYSDTHDWETNSYKSDTSPNNEHTKKGALFNAAIKNFDSLNASNNSKELIYSLTKTHTEIKKMEQQN